MILKFLNEQKNNLISSISFFIVFLILNLIFEKKELSLFFLFFSLIILLLMISKKTRYINDLILNKLQIFTTFILTNISLIVIFSLVVIPYGLIYKLFKFKKKKNTLWSLGKTNNSNCLNLYD